MRPKKKVLIVNSDEAELSTRSFLFATKGFRVVSVGDARGAIEAASAQPFDLVICELELADADGNKLIGALKLIAMHVPMMLCSRLASVEGRAHAADAFLGKGTSPLKLLECARHMSARKRGPRKLPVSVPSRLQEVDCA